MREQFRILNTAATLGEFTMARLAEVAGVKVSTARTVISREPAVFEQVGSEPTGKPGGQLRIYRVKANAMVPLLNRLRKVVADFGVPAAADDPPVAGGVAGVPSPLLVAYKLLARFERATTNEQQRQVLESAKAAYLAAVRDWARVKDHAEPERRVFDVHARAIRAIDWLATAKAFAFLDRTPLPELLRFHRTLIQLAQDLQALEHTEHALTVLGKAKEVDDVILNNTRQIAVIDAIKESRDQLTTRVRELLKTAVGVEQIQYFEVANTGLTGFFRRSVSLRTAPWPAFVTLDSKHGGEKLIQKILRECRQPGIYVIDRNYSAATSKVVLNHGGHYYPCASAYDDKELTVVLRRPFEGIKPTPADQRELPMVCST